MSVRSFGAAVVCAALICASPVSAAKAVPAPAGWDHAGHNASSDNVQTSDVYQTGSGDFKEQLVVLSDTSTTADAIVDRIHKNVADAKAADAKSMQVNYDKVQPCNGQSARSFEFVLGPEIKRMKIDRLVVPDGSGSIQITYSRPEPAPYSDDVKAALAAYCGTP